MDIEIPTPKTAIAASHAARMSFEQKATAIIVATLSLALALCFVAIMPFKWAADIGSQVSAMRDNIMYFVAAIGGALGMSWTRGAHDLHIDAKDDGK